MMTNEPPLVNETLPMENPMLSAQGTHEPRPHKARWVWHLVGVWNRWKARRAEYRRKKAEDDRIWDYWMAKDAYERGDITAEQFFYDERFFPGWKAAIEKRKAEQNNPNDRDVPTRPERRT